VLLALAPLVSAIAAGNTVIIKPSEHTPHTSAMLKHFISTIFPEDEITVAEGGREAAEHLLQLPFDHIFFTGGTETGKKVMKAAAENLSPVTLELGGKTPVYIHHDSDVEDAAEKITTAKLVNGGQTCVAPDYVLVHHDVKEEFIKSLNKYFKTFYDPASPAERENFASVINESHYHRLMNLGAVKQPRLSAELLFEPVVLSDITPEHPVMHEEIFGPILPVISVINEEEAIKQIHSLPKPLGIYVFTGDRKLMKHFTQATNSGSICFTQAFRSEVLDIAEWGGLTGKPDFLVSATKG
jgi:aldehyde dehydrogenase (NAD+)